MKGRAAQSLYILVLLVIMLLGAGMAIVFSLPFQTIQRLGDSLARDGSLELLTQGRFEALTFLRYAGVGCILLAFFAWSVRAKGIAWTDRFLLFIQVEWAAVQADSKSFLAALQNEKSSWAAWILVAGMTSVSAINKVVLLSKPMGHDESYTFIAFASRPLYRFIRDYHLPNNHIFHSILVHWSYQLFGDDTWAIRLPAFLAGVLLVPAGFLAARRLYNQQAGLLAAGMLAVLQVIRDYSTSARGYALLALSTILLVYLGSRALKEKNRLVWLLWVITAALGFYTIPIMLYPFTMVATWMGISWLAGETAPEYRGRYWIYLLVAGISTAFLTILFYLPVFIYSGIGSLTSNTFVQPLTWDEFSGNLGFRFYLAWVEWHYGLPSWLKYLSVAGFFIGMILNQRVSNYKIPAILGLALGAGTILLVQQVAPEPRVWFFAITVYILTAAGGLVGVGQWLQKNVKWPAVWGHIGAASLLLCMTLWSGIQSYMDYQRVQQGNQGSTELAIRYLSQVLGENDVIVTNMEEGPATWYYARRYGIPGEHIFKIKNKDFAYAWVLVSPGYGQSPESVLTATSDIDVEMLDLATAELMHQESNMDIYRVKRK